MKYFIIALLILRSTFFVAQSIVYDDMNRIVSIIYSDNSVLTYDYDKLGNRISYEIIPNNNCSYVVNNTFDNGLGSLRKAIECSSPGDTIEFSSSLIGQTIDLTSEKIELNKDLVFKQPSSQVIKIRALFSGSVFTITNGSSIYMENIHLYGGDESPGRAINNQGTLTLKDVNIYETSPYEGMGSTIENSGTLTIYGNCNILVE